MNATSLSAPKQERVRIEITPGELHKAIDACGPLLREYNSGTRGTHFWFMPEDDHAERRGGLASYLSRRALFIRDGQPCDPSALLLDGVIAEHDQAVRRFLRKRASEVEAESEPAPDPQPESRA